MVNQFCRRITEKLENDPQTFTAPVRTWMETSSKMNDSSIISALHCFGKVPQVKAKYLQSSKMIGVQPTSIARRKTPLGGRRALIPGRPPKCSRKEHQYSKENRKKSAPHSLAKCVEDNTCLGGHHQCISVTAALPLAICVHSCLPNSAVIPFHMKDCSFSSHQCGATDPHFDGNGQKATQIHIPDNRYQQLSNIYLL